MSDLCFLSATELANRIARRDLSAREVMQAHLERIAAVNPKVNAVVTLVAEQAMNEAARADERQAAGGPLRPLHGLPIVHKDLFETAGVRTTYGSPFFRDFVPGDDALIVKRSHDAGAIMVGKSNTPEFGAGSQTFNAVFGATRNPYDLTKTCGGSTGGGVVALATGMVPLADGSDTGGSLRNPAAFCNVVGLRPSPGRVPIETGTWSPLSVSGPMGRTVADVALLLTALDGPDARAPLSFSHAPAAFSEHLEADMKGKRVAWFRDLGGIPIEPEIVGVVNDNRKVFERLGCVVEEAEPDFSGVEFAFPTLRHPAFHALCAPLAARNPDWVKDTIRWEIAEAQRQTAADIGRAHVRQAQMYLQALAFFDRYDYFVLPVTQVSPFDVNIPYPTEISGVRIETYLDWMRSCWYVSFMTNPAISVPGGFTKAGLPVGLQIVGRHRGELPLLQMAYAFEQATRHGERRPSNV